MEEDPAKSKFLCPICDRGFSRREHLKRHHASKHEATASFTCEHCDRSFTRRDILQRHLRTHEPNARKRKRRTDSSPSVDDPFSLPSQLPSVDEGLSLPGQLPPVHENFFLERPLDDPFHGQIGLPVSRVPTTETVLSSLGTDEQAHSLHFQSPISPAMPSAAGSEFHPGLASQTGAFPFPFHSQDAPADFGLHAGLLTPSYEMLFGESDKPVWEQLMTKLEPLAVQQSANNIKSMDPSFASTSHQDTLDVHQPDLHKQSSSFAAQTPAATATFGLFGEPLGREQEASSGPRQLSTSQFQQCLYGLYQEPHLASMVLPEEIASFPTVEDVNRFIDAYFLRFDLIYPFLHKATFDIQSCPWGLLLSIAAYGARYMKDPMRYSDKSVALLSAAKRCLDYAMYENFAIVREVWWQKACHLLNLAGLPTMSSSRFEAAQVGDRIAVLTCHRQKWLSDPSTNQRADAELPLRHRWLSWVAQEERKRLALCIFALESNSSLVWGSSTSDLWNEVACATVPCSLELWQASDEHTWASLLPSTPPTRFHELFRQACSPATRFESQPAFVNHFTMMILLWFVHVFTAKAKTTLATTSYLFEPLTSEAALAPGLTLQQEAQLKNCRETFERIADMRAGTVDGTMLARHTALIGLTDHLPAAFLQAFAKQTTQSSTWTYPPIIKDWIESDDGRRARESAYYAAQIYRLFGEQEGDPDSVNVSNVSNCFSLFYAAMILTLYCRFQAQHVLTDGEPEIMLNYLRLRSDPLIEDWVQGDSGRVSLEGIGYLNSPDTRVRLVAASRILDIFGNVLAKNVNVSLCKQFRTVLLQLKVMCDSDIEALSTLGL